MVLTYHRINLPIANAGFFGNNSGTFVNADTVSDLASFILRSILFFSLLVALSKMLIQKFLHPRGNSIEYVIASLNPTLRGWYGYFQHAHRFTFSAIDDFVRRRLLAMLRKQKHRPSQGRCLHDHKQWPNAFFAGLGLFTMSEAHRLACQSR